MPLTDKAPGLTACSPSMSFTTGSATIDQQLAPAPSTEPVRLDLACGQTPEPGFKGVDLSATGAEKVDLLKFPWPWEDSSVDELRCSHFLEHIPARMTVEEDLLDANQSDYVDHENYIDRLVNVVGKDLLCAFMDEAWRVLKHQGKFTIYVPCGRCTRGFQDPTHRRFFMAETFLYFSRKWREEAKQDHRVELSRCNFDVNVDPLVPTEMTTLHPLAQARRFNESWNVIFDWQARLVAIKP